MSNPIKDKFIEYMELFGLTKETQKGYISTDGKPHPIPIALPL